MSQRVTSSQAPFSESPYMTAWRTAGGHSWYSWYNDNVTHALILFLVIIALFPLFSIFHCSLIVITAVDKWLYVIPRHVTDVGNTVIVLLVGTGWESSGRSEGWNVVGQRALALDSLGSRNWASNETLFSVGPHETNMTTVWNVEYCFKQDLFVWVHRVDNVCTSSGIK